MKAMTMVGWLGQTSVPARTGDEVVVMLGARAFAIVSSGPFYDVELKLDISDQIFADGNSGVVDERHTKNVVGHSVLQCVHSGISPTCSDNCQEKVLSPLCAHCY